MAVLTICGFILRGYWVVTHSAMLDTRLVKIAPHVIDTFFLLSGIALIVTLRLQVMSQAWLLAKFAGLLLYIVFGAIALRPGRSIRVRTWSFCLALLMFAFIVGAAIVKSPYSWAALP